MAETDGGIVRRVLDGDVEAFALLVARHRDRGARFAAAMLGDPFEAEEAVQDALVRAYRGLAGCRDPDRFGAWFLQILVNRCRTRGTRAGRRGAVFVRDEVALAQAASAEASDAEWREEIAVALAKLEPRMREAFVLKHVEGLEYTEMAPLVGASVPALKMRVKRACERLRELLGDARGGADAGR